MEVSRSAIIFVCGVPSMEFGWVGVLMTRWRSPGVLSYLSSLSPESRSLMDMTEACFLGLKNARFLVCCNPGGGVMLRMNLLFLMTFLPYPSTWIRYFWNVRISTVAPVQSYFLQRNVVWFWIMTMLPTFKVCSSLLPLLCLVTISRFLLVRLLSLSSRSRMNFFSIW